MRVIPPQTISTLSSSTIAEPDTSVGEVAWVSAASYSAGNRVIRTNTHKVYEALSAHSGRTTVPELDTVYWFEVGPTNRWAMFDLLRNTSSQIPSGGFSTVFSTGMRADTIAVLGARLSNLTITVTSVAGGGTIYGPVTFTMADRNVTDYYDYFFMDFSYKPSIIISNLPPYKDAIITISSTGYGSIASVVVGISEFIGFTKRGHKNDAQNYSLINRDAYGNSTLAKRRNVPKTSQSLVVKKTDLANVLKLRDTLNAVPAVWMGLDDVTEGYFESLLILGIYKDISLTIDNQEYLSCNLELEEL